MEERVMVEHRLLFGPEELDAQEGVFLEALRESMREVCNTYPYLKGYKLADIGFLPESDRINLRFYFEKNICQYVETSRNLQFFTE